MVDSTKVDRPNQTNFSGNRQARPAPATNPRCPPQEEEDICQQKSSGRPEDNNEYLGILPCKGREGGYYPNVDISIWLRNIFKNLL